MNLPLDDLGKVRVGEELERCARLVVKVGGALLEALAGVLDEAHVQRWSHDAEPQLVRRYPLDLSRKAEGVDEHCSRHIRGVGRQATIEACIYLLGQRCAGAFADDVVPDGRIVDLQVQPGHKLLVNRTEARVDVVDVDRGCIGWLVARLP